MKTEAWVYAFISVLVATAGVLLIVLLVPNVILQNPSPQVMLLPIFTGLAVLAFWVWMAKKVNDEHEDMVLFESRPAAPKPRKVKKGHR